MNVTENLLNENFLKSTNYENGDDDTKCCQKMMFCNKKRRNLKFTNFIFYFLAKILNWNLILILANKTENVGEHLEVILFDKANLREASEGWIASIDDVRLVVFQHRVFVVRN